MYEKNIDAYRTAKKSRRGTVALLLLFALIPVIGSCDHQDVITVLGEDSSNMKALKELKGGYETQHPGLRIEFNADDFATASDKASRDFAKSTGIYDIVLQYNFELANFVRNKYVYNLQELQSLVPDQTRTSFESDLFQNAWKEVGYYFADPGDPSKGEVAIGYPFAANTMLLVYNRQLLEDPKHQAAYREKFHEELAPPKTWQQFEHIAAYFSPTNKSTYGVCLQGAKDGWLYYEWANFLFGMNGAVMNKKYGWQSSADTPITLDSPQALEAAKFYLRLKSYNFGDFFGMDAEKQREAMRGGQVALAIMWSDYVFDLAFPKSGNADLDKRFGFAPIPGEKSMLAGGVYYINKQSKHPKEAYEYILHVMQKENQVEHMKRGLCSALKTAYDDPEIQKLPYADALKRSLERGVYMAEAGPDSNAIQETLTDYLQKIWRSELSAEDGIKAAKREIEIKRAEIYKNLQQGGK